MAKVQAQIEYLSPKSHEVVNYATMDELIQSEFPLAIKKVTPNPSNLMPFNGCPTGDVIITSQAEINALTGCTEINGDLIINGTNIIDGPETITDLSPLNDLTNVTGDIMISFLPEVTALPTFESLTQLNGSYSVQNLALVEALPNFPNQAVINGNLVFGNLPLVEELPAGLANVTTLNGGYIISGLPLITTLPNLPNQAVMNGNVQFGNLPLITSLPAGLNLLTEVNPGLDVEDNPGNEGTLSLFQLPETVTLPNFSNLETVTNLSLNQLPQSVFPSFDNLTTIRRNFTLIGNQNITDFTGFSNILSDAEGLTISIQANPSLEIIDAFDGIPSIRQILLANNTSLLEINGFDALEDTERLGIAFDNNNAALEGFENITKIGWLQLLASTLTSIDFLPNLEHIYGAITIQSNSNLVDMPSLDGVTYLNVPSFNITPNREVNISNNILLESLGTLNLTSSDHFTIIAINSNPQLSNIDFLSGISGEINNIQIFNNASIENVDGLSSVNKIIGFLQISSNNQLSNIDGIADIDISEAIVLNISNNALLSQCTVDSVCEYLGLNIQDNESFSVTISGNGNEWNECFNLAAAQEACGICPPGNIFLNTQAEVDDFFCDVVQGDLIINGTNITNLDALIVLESIQGNLIISETNLVNLNGLESLTSISGAISIENNNLLENMWGLSSVAGSINFFYVDSNPMLTSLGIENITEIESFLTIINNNSLIDLSGLNNISNVGSQIQASGNQVVTISNNTSLESLDGLEALATINNGSLAIISNPVLTTIEGIANLNPASVQEIAIINNAQLSECAIATVCAVLADEDKTLQIAGNSNGCLNVSEVEDACDAVTDICPPGDVIFTNQAQVDAFLFQYPDCTEINGNVIVNGEDSSITSLEGLVNLETITGNLSILSTNVQNLDDLANLTGTLNGIGIANNSQLNDISGLGGITQVNREFIVTNNETLEDLEGLNLTNIGSGVSDAELESQLVLNISANANMTSLNGLESLVSLNNRMLIIANNAQLTDIAAIENIDPATVGGIYILGNESLSMCNIDLLCNFGSLDEGNQVFIENNDDGCNTGAEVEDACQNMSNELFLASDVSIYPNPFTNQLSIQLPSNMGKVKVSIVNVSGRVLMQKEVSTFGQFTNLDQLAKGLYFIQIRSENGQTLTQKLIK